MSLDSAAPGSPRFSIRDVIGDSLRVFGRNFVVFFLLSLAIRVIWLLGPMPNPAAGAVTLADWPSQVVSPLLRLALAGLAQVLFVFGTLRTLQGEKARIGDTLRGLRAIVPVVIVTILCFLPQTFAFLLDVVFPQDSMIGAVAGLAIAVIGLVLVVLWWIAVPVIAVEGKGPFAGLARTARLTEGRRWPVLGVIAVVAIMLFLGVYLATKVGGMTTQETAAPIPTTVPGAVWFVVTALFSAFFAILATVIYYRLRAEKEADAPAAIARDLA